MVAAAEAIFSVVSDDLALDRIVPSPLDLRVGDAVAKAVAIASNASTSPCENPQAGRASMPARWRRPAALIGTRRRSWWRRSPSDAESVLLADIYVGGTAVLRFRRAPRNRR